MCPDSLALSEALRVNVDLTRRTAASHRSQAMNLDLLKLRALADAATPAPWFARGRHLSHVPNDSGMGATLPTNHIGVMAERDDAAFIAAARSAVPALLDQVAELEAGLRAEVDQLRAEVARMRPVFEAAIDRGVAISSTCTPDALCERCVLDAAIAVLVTK